MRKLRIPAVLAVATISCGGEQARDAAVHDSGACKNFCTPTGTDAGVCPSNPFACVSSDRTCPAGCVCDFACQPKTAEGEMNCPLDGGIMCADRDGSCPAGCEATPFG